MTETVYAITWTETALRMAARIEDKRVRRLIVDRADSLSRDPEKQGKPLTGELTGCRSLRAVGQRDRIIYRVDGRRIVVLVVAVGRRKEGDRSDIYELARKLVRQRLLPP